MKEFYQMLVGINQTYRFWWGITQILLMGTGVWIGWLIRSVFPEFKAYFKERKLKKKEAKG